MNLNKKNSDLNIVKDLLKDIVLETANSEQTTIGQLCAEQLNQFVNVKYNSKVNLNRYLNACYSNAKQKQSNNPDAGKKSCERSGPGRRIARLPKGKVSGYKTITVNVPSARGGRSAHRFVLNQKIQKVNKKEKIAARKLLCTQFLKKAKLYLIKNEEFHCKTKQLVKNISNSEFKSALDQNKKCVLIYRKTGDGPSALNFVNGVTLNQYEHALHKVKSGTFRPRAILSKEGLVDLLLRVYRYEY